MSAFRFVTLVCDTCFGSTTPGTSLTEEDARADAAATGWTEPTPGEDRCASCSGTTRHAAADDLGFGVPVPVSVR